MAMGVSGARGAARRHATASNGLLSVVAEAVLVSACGPSSGCGATRRPPPPAVVDPGAPAPVHDLTPASSDASAPDTGPSQVSAVVPMDASSDAPAVDASQFDADQWARDHGVTRWERGAACENNMQPHIPLPGWHRACSCQEAVTLETQPPIDLLVCSPPRWRPVPTDYTVVYIADHDRLRSVLDIPTGASIVDDLPDPGGSPDNNYGMIGRVGLGVGAIGPHLVVFDIFASAGLSDPLVVAKSRRACAAAVARAESRASLEEQRTYRSVCASIGEYAWTGSRLLRVRVQQ